MTDPAPDVLVDTSVALVLSTDDSTFYEPTLTALDGLALGLSGHAAFETYSTLTRSPPPFRRSPEHARAFIEHNFPASRFLSAASQFAWLLKFAEIDVRGGQVYDAMVGACAKEHGLTLVTRDGRARQTYAALGADVRVLP